MSMAGTMGSGVATFQGTPLVLGQCAPDAGVLTGIHGPTGRWRFPESTVAGVVGRAGIVVWVGGAGLAEMVMRGLPAVVGSTGGQSWRRRRDDRRRRPVPTQ